MQTEQWQSGTSPAADLPAEIPFARWMQRHRTAIDIAVAAVLFAYDSMYLGVQYGGLGLLSLSAFVTLELLSAAICVLYVIRHRALLQAAGLIAVLSYGCVVFGIGATPVPLAVLFLLTYVLASARGWAMGLVSATAMTVWLLAAAQPLLQKDYLRIGEVGVLVLAAYFAATLGLLARSRRRHIDGLRELNEQLARERDARARIAEAEERARIAREMHDIVSQGLGTMIVMSDGAAQTVESTPQQAGAAMARVRDTGRDAMAEMRRMLDVLRSDDPAARAPQPGLDRLEQLLDETRAVGLPVDLTVSGTPTALHPGVDLAAYRIIQESLTNALRHGGPHLSRAAVTVQYTESTVEVRIADDGGSSVDTSTASTGHGLIGMRERASAYGGSFEAGPRADGGFEVRAALPIGGAE